MEAYTCNFHIKGKWNLGAGWAYPSILSELQA